MINWSGVYYSRFALSGGCKTRETCGLDPPLGQLPASLVFRGGSRVAGWAPFALLLENITPPHHCHGWYQVLMPRMRWNSCHHLAQHSSSTACSAWTTSLISISSSRSGSRLIASTSACVYVYDARSLARDKGTNCNDQ